MLFTGGSESCGFYTQLLISMSEILIYLLAVNDVDCMNRTMITKTVSLNRRVEA